MAWVGEHWRRNNMAESKRNSVAGKVATPKTAGPPATSTTLSMVDPIEALGKSIGAR